MSNPSPSTTTLSAHALTFADDERIHFSKETGTWRLEQEDGTELEYDAAKGSWVAVVSNGSSLTFFVYDFCRSMMIW